jgi:hypothetical protein
MRRPQVFKLARVLRPFFREELVRSDEEKPFLSLRDSNQKKRCCYGATF